MATKRPAEVHLSAHEEAEFRKCAWQGACAALAAAAFAGTPEQIAEAAVIIAERGMEFLKTGDGRA